MSLNKKEKATICCLVARGFREALAPETKDVRLRLLASKEISPEDETEYRRLIRMGLDELDPLFEKALVVMEDVPKPPREDDRIFLTDEQRMTILCHIKSGVSFSRAEVTQARLDQMASTPIKMPQVDYHRKLAALSPEELTVTFNNTLEWMVASHKNHLGMNEKELTAAKAAGKIIYRPVKGKNGLYRSQSGALYTKDANGTMRRVNKKESKKEKRIRRRAERLAAGKGR